MISPHNKTLLSKPLFKEILQFCSVMQIFVKNSFKRLFKVMGSDKCVLKSKFVD